MENLSNKRTRGANDGVIDLPDEQDESNVAINPFVNCVLPFRDQQINLLQKDFVADVNSEKRRKLSFSPSLLASPSNDVSLKVDKEIKALVDRRRQLLDKIYAAAAKDESNVAINHVDNCVPPGVNGEPTE